MKANPALGTPRSSSTKQPSTSHLPAGPQPRVQSAKLKPRVQTPKMSPELFDQLDKNRDGVVDREEWSNALKAETTLLNPHSGSAAKTAGGIVGSSGKLQGGAVGGVSATRALNATGQATPSPSP